MMIRGVEECFECGGEIKEEEDGYVCEICGAVIQEESEEFVEETGVVEEL